METNDDEVIIINSWDEADENLFQSGEVKEEYVERLISNVAEDENIQEHALKEENLKVDIESLRAVTINTPSDNEEYILGVGDEGLSLNSNDDDTAADDVVLASLQNGVNQQVIEIIELDSDDENIQAANGTNILVAEKSPSELNRNSQNSSQCEIPSLVIVKVESVLEERNKEPNIPYENISSPDPKLHSKHNLESVESALKEGDKEPNIHSHENISSPDHKLHSTHNLESDNSFCKNPVGTSDKQVFLCNVCPFSAKTRFSLARHLVAHTDTDPEVSGGLNSSKGKDSSDNTSNIKIKTGKFKEKSDIKFSCRFCSFNSRFRFALKKHLLRHTENSKTKPKPLSETKLKLKPKVSLQCRICSFRAKTNVGLSNHVKLHKKPSKIISKVDSVVKQTEFKCQKCNFKTNQKQVFLKHTKDNCLKRTKQFLSKPEEQKTDKQNSIKEKVKDQKGQEIAMPSKGNQIIKCKYCSFKSYSYGTYNYKKHEILHTKYNQAIFRCSLCTYKTTYKALECHVNKVHKKEYLSSKSNLSFKCLLCSKKLSSLFIVQKHAQEHSESTRLTENQKLSNFKIGKIAYKKPERPRNKDVQKDVHICKDCSYETTAQADFDRHLKSHKSQETLQCSECDFRGFRVSVSKHLKNVHHKTSSEVRKEFFGKQSLHLSNRTSSKSELSKQMSTAKDKDSSVIKNPKPKLVNKAAESVTELNKNKSTNSEDLLNLLSPNGAKLKQFDSSTLLFVCEVCDFVTNHKQALLAHKESHLVAASSSESDEPEKELSKEKSPIKEHTCDLCECVFQNENALENHFCSRKRNLKYSIEMDQEVIKFKCNLCSLTTSQHWRMKKHLLVHKRLKLAKDKRGIEKYFVKPEKNTSKINSVVIKCSFCNFQSLNKSAIKEHTAIVHKSILNCKFCDFQTLVEKTLKLHEENVHSDKKTEVVKDSHKSVKYKCDTCSFQTNHEVDLDYHKIMHININEVKVYESPSLSVKVDKSNQELSFTFQCDFCSYSTTNRLYFTNHLRKHRNYLKSNSGKTLENITPMTRKRKHHDRSVYLEDVQKSELNRCKSEQVYVDSRKLTPQKTSLRKLEHEEDKEKTKVEFCCKICKFKSNIRIKLNKHIQTEHNQNLPYLKSKSSKKPEKTSIKMRSKRAIFKCEECFYRTKVKVMLDKHYKSCHVAS